MQVFVVNGSWYTVFWRQPTYLRKDKDPLYNKRLHSNWLPFLHLFIVYVDCYFGLRDVEEVGYRCGASDLHL
jgi:hypothetical protein